MPAIAPKSLVLVSGASGFVAAHVCQQLLARGYAVRGTVRSAAKGQFLADLFKSPRFEFVIVEDIEKEGAFDACLVGVEGIAHTASPFHFNVTDPHKDLINPAVQGTLNMLRSAHKANTIKRIAITSSYAAVLYPTPEAPGYVFTEKDWNEYSPKQVELLGVKVDGSQAYRASKTLAEKAAWEFIEKNPTSFDIAPVNPPLVFGPIIHECSSAASLNTSVAAFYGYLTGKKIDQDATLASGSFVDVRDVAQIHIDALVTPEAGNQRFLVATAAFSYQPLLDVLFKPENDALRAHFPKAVRGIPGAPTPVQPSIDSTLTRKTFGWTPIPMEKTILDMTASLAERQKDW